MSVPQVSGNELNISELVGRAQLPSERIECRMLFERGAAVEVTEAFSQHEDAEPSGNHCDLKHPIAFMNSHFPQVSASNWGFPNF